MARNIQQAAPGAALVLVGLAAVAGSFGIALDHDGSWAPRIFPLMSATALILFGGLMLRPAALQAEDRPPAALPRAPLMLLGLVVLYLWLIGTFGYLISTALVTPAALRLFGIRNPVTLAVGAVAAPITFHLVFFELLGVFPPYGSWFDLADVIGG